MRLVINKFSILCSLMFSYLTVTNASEMTKEHESWLKEKFSSQHEQLIPVVAVADMYFACNQARKTDVEKLSVKALIVDLDRNKLAQKLSDCLGEESANSDTALNFGLIACFDEQLKELPEKDRAVKQKLVRQAIAKLSKAERQKSFTQCVTDQAIGYLR